MKKSRWKFRVGDRVQVFDAVLFKNDRDTPLSQTVRPATVLVCRYDQYGRELIDVRFDHRGISHGHFASGAQPCP
jgi:hypothetical protein